MIIYKNVDYGIYAYQIGFFKVKRIGEIVWSDHYDSKNEKFYLRIEGFYVAEERRRHGLGRKLLNKTNILDSILQRKWLIVQKQITKCGMIL